MTKSKWSLALLVLGAAAAAVAFAGDDADSAALVKALPSAKQSLADGIRAAAKDPAVAISAKFEMDDHGKLSLSVYTAGKGLGVDSEDNVLAELAGSPETDKWTPETEVFKDVAHVARSSQQLTLMALSPLSLADVVAKASGKGTVVSVTPRLRDRKAVFVVETAADGKLSEWLLDAKTGEAIPPKAK
jgi:hypothetical protein